MQKALIDLMIFLSIRAFIRYFLLSMASAIWPCAIVHCIFKSLVTEASVEDSAVARRGEGNKVTDGLELESESDRRE